MSDHKSVKDLPKGGEKIDAAKVKGLQMLLGFIGIVCLGIVWVFMFMPGSKEEGSDEAVQSLMSNSASYSYLFAVMFGLTIGVGGLFWTILHHATNSGWGIVVRRQMENLAGIIPVVFILMIPFLCPQVRGDLWEWTTKVESMKEYASKNLDAKLAEEVEHWEALEQNAMALVKAEKETLTKLELVSDQGIQQDRIAEAEAILAEVQSHVPTEESVKKHLMKEYDGLLATKYFGYFNWSIIRLILMAAIFVALSFAIRSWSLQNDKTGDIRYFLRCRYWSCGFIFPFVVAYTLVVIDLVMTLDYKWFSTMWGVYLFAGAALNSMALIIILVTWLRDRNTGFKNIVTMEHYHLMGKLMFAFCVFWAYIAFSQYFLIWYANITEETSFFLLRNSGSWQNLSIFLVVGHFFIPFVILLWRPVKKIPKLIALVSLWNLFMHVIDMYWIVIPERGPSLTADSGHPTLWLNDAEGKPLMFATVGLDILALVGVIGVLGFILLGIVKRSSLYPWQDPRLEESMNAIN